MVTMDTENQGIASDYFLDDLLDLDDVPWSPKLTASGCHQRSNNPNIDNTEEISSMEVDYSAVLDNPEQISSMIQEMTDPSGGVWLPSWIAKGRMVGLSGPEKWLSFEAPSGPLDVGKIEDAVKRDDFLTLLNLWQSKMSDIDAKQLELILATEIGGNSRWFKNIIAEEWRPTKCMLPVEQHSQVSPGSMACIAKKYAEEIESRSNIVGRFDAYWNGTSSHFTYVRLLNQKALQGRWWTYPWGFNAQSDSDIKFIETALMSRNDNDFETSYNDYSVDMSATRKQKLIELIIGLSHHRSVVRRMDLMLQTRETSIVLEDTTKGLSYGRLMPQNRNEIGVIVQSGPQSLESKLKQCAEVMQYGDRRTAYMLLDEVKNSSSARGNSREKLAHCFAKGFEARLSGNWTSMHQKFLTGQITQTDVEKAYAVFYKACPIQKASYFLSNQTIMDQVKEAKALHIIDFGIGFGFQWPEFMKQLSERGGGPPKLRITGIDMPLLGMYPNNQINHAKTLLEHYAQKYNVPFEYRGIESKWEDVNIESLNVDNNEVLIVNCLSHSGYVSGDMLAMHGPSSPVLELIRKLNPTAFVHGMAAVSSDTPSFVSCFKEAWQHYSALFDMVEKNIQGNEKDSLLIEIFGREILNIVAYRGPEEVKGPETNEKWETRCWSYAFGQCNVNPDILRNAQDKIKSDYKKDFVIKEENKNVLLRWKGRTVFTLSVWQPN